MKSWIPRLRIVFMGSPEFAVPTLKKLLEDGHEVIAVVTNPDKPAGRGLKLQPTSVKRFAQEQGLKVLTPSRLKDEHFIEQLRELNADVFVVVAFRILPEEVWRIPPLGTINLHASLLPDYRGAAPIHWAIINGETLSGLTTFFIDKQVDTGEILLQCPIAIPWNFTAGQLHDVMMEKGADLMSTTLWGVAKGNIKPIAQPKVDSLHKAPKIRFEDCLIPWHKSVVEVYNHIRGLSPFPGAYTYAQNRLIKIYFATIADEPLSTALPGTLKIEKKRLLVACQDGWLKIERLQLSGKKIMETQAFLNGYYSWLKKIERFTITPKNQQA